MIGLINVDRLAPDSIAIESACRRTLYPTLITSMKY